MNTAIVPGSIAAIAKDTGKSITLAQGERHI